MKALRKGVSLLCLASSLGAAEPAFELRGAIVGDGPTKLSLRDRATDTTRWVEVGQNFAGCKVVTGYNTTAQLSELTGISNSAELKVGQTLRTK